jgi:hypothetical protein
METFDMGLLTAKPLTSKEAGRDLLNLILDTCPTVAPELYGNYEPLEARFDPSDVQGVLSSWKRPFLWRRHRPMAEGNVWMGDPGIHEAVYISGSVQATELCTIENLFRKLAASLTADFGYLHCVTPMELSADHLDESVLPFTQGVTTYQLRKWLPNLCWAMALGSPYVRLFGKERLLSSPARVVLELAPDIIYIQLSETLLDLSANYEGVAKVREAVKAHLDFNAFFDPLLGIDGDYNTPEFEV